MLTRPHCLFDRCFPLQRLNKVQVPFILLHRTGFTRVFVQSVVSLVQEGLSMEAICRHIEATRHHYVADIIHQLINDYNLITGQ